MKFRKRPVVIEAIQWKGKPTKKMVDFMSQSENVVNGIMINTENKLIIPTLEGNMTADIGDWIIRGINDEIYPCKPDIFKKTYEKVED